jgi:hypothetical protein
MENTLPQDPQPQIIPETHVKSSTSSNTLKIIVLGLLVLLPISAAGGYYLGKNTSVNDISSDNPIVVALPSPNQGVVCTLDAKICPDGSSVGRVGPNCEFERCPETQDSESMKQVVLKGYYKKYDGTKWEWNNQEVMCDGLVTMGGNENLIAKFRTNAESGNTLNKIIDNDFLININLKPLSQAQKQLVEQSSPSKLIELTVSERNEVGAGVSTCYSQIDITSVKSI